MAMATAYRCAHCLKMLPVDETGQPQPCDDHPDGAIELIPSDEAE